MAPTQISESVVGRYARHPDLPTKRVSTSLATPCPAAAHFLISLIKRGSRALRSPEINALTKHGRARRRRTSPTARHSFHRDRRRQGDASSPNADSRRYKHARTPASFLLVILFSPGVTMTRRNMQKKNTRKTFRGTFTQRYAIPSH